MPDIFISYKKEEHAVAARLAARLTEAGYDVWWDSALLAGERFEDEISSVLASSRAVIVLWSRQSVESDWVKAEAESARSQRKVLPAVIDDVPLERLPLLFRGLHLAQLRDWTGEAEHPGFAELLKSLGDRLGASPASLSTSQAEARLADAADEAAAWSAISGNPRATAGDYRDYLRRFGTRARFAEVAELRISRLEAAAEAPPVRRSRRFRPAIVLPLVALLVIGAGAAWYLLRNPDMFISQAVKDAAANCTVWSTGNDLDWKTMLPQIKPGIAADCEMAAAAFPKNGDYQGMLAMVRILAGRDTQADAAALAQRGIELGSAISNDVLGVMYQLGINFRPDPARAAALFRTAVAMHLPRSAARFCALAADSNGPVSFTDAAEEVVADCTSSSNAGDALGTAMLGILYEYGGFKLHPDIPRAAALYRRAADQNLIIAKVLLGAMDYRGTGVPHDPAEAFALFKSAATLGYPAGLRWLAIANELGIGTPVDIVNAGQLYDQAQNADDIVAIFLYGYHESADYVIGAFDDLEIGRLAAVDNPVGNRILGQTLERGYHRTVDVPQALAAYGNCVEANVICKFILASYYKYRMQPPDPARAAPLYESGALAGETHNQFELGLMYELGQGEPQDLDRAMTLYRLASAQGNELASQRLIGLAAPQPAPAN